MNFTYFAKILYPRIGGKDTKAEFVITLVTEIMEKSFTDIETNHPLSNKKDDTLMRVFNGKRHLSKRDATTILSHLDTDRFGNYLAKFSNDIIDIIGSDMQDNGVVIVNDDIIDTCTDLFVEIIKDCSTGVISRTIKKYKQWLLDEIDHYYQGRVFNQLQKIYKKAEKNHQVAELIRNIFELESGTYHIEDFLTRTPLKANLDLNDPSIDIYMLFQTVYEIAIETEAYDEAAELSEKLNLYIKKASARSSKNNRAKIDELKKEIISLLCEIYEAD